MTFKAETVARWEALPHQTRDAVRDFADTHGRAWKSKLRTLWLSGRDDSHLRKVRNHVGPSGLDHIKL